MWFWLNLINAVFGGLFFLAHVVWMIHALRYARCADDRWEAFGSVIPGTAGLLMFAATYTFPSFLSMALTFFALFVLILGRLVFDCIVWNVRRGR